MITGIIVALSEELSTLKTVPNALWERCMIRGKFIFLTDDIILIYAGAGAENAQKATELAVSKGATKLISWGCAAALSPDLKMGDLVLADSLLNSNGLEIAVNATWHQHVKTVLGSDIVAYKGALFNSNVLISTATENKLFTQNRRDCARYGKRRNCSGRPALRSAIFSDSCNR